MSHRCAGQGNTLRVRKTVRWRQMQRAQFLLCMIYNWQINTFAKDTEECSITAEDVQLDKVTGTAPIALVGE